jgi:hypothetical protein
MSLFCSITILTTLSHEKRDMGRESGMRAGVGKVFYAGPVRGGEACLAPTGFLFVRERRGHLI